MKQIKDSSAELRKTYEENKDSYDEEKANEVIGTLSEQINKCDNFKSQLKTGLEQVNAAIAQAK